MSEFYPNEKAQAKARSIRLSLGSGSGSVRDLNLLSCNASSVNAYQNDPSKALKLSSSDGSSDADKAVEATGKGLLPTPRVAHLDLS